MTEFVADQVNVMGCPLATVHPLLGTSEQVGGRRTYGELFQNMSLEVNAPRSIGVVFQFNVALFESTYSAQTSPPIHERLIEELVGFERRITSLDRVLKSTFCFPRTRSVSSSKSLFGFSKIKSNRASFVVTSETTYSRKLVPLEVATISSVRSA